MRYVYGIGFGVAAYLLIQTIGQFTVGSNGTVALLALVVAAGIVYLFYSQPHLADQLTAKFNKGDASNLTYQPGKIVVFGNKIDRPAFLDRAGSLWGRKPFGAFFLTERGEVRRVEIPRLRRSPLNERRLMESLYVSARYEMKRRGNPFEDAVGDPIWPLLFPQGLLIDQIDNGDGRLSNILAVDVGELLDLNDWQEAYRIEGGRRKTAWDETPYAIVQQRAAKPQPGQPEPRPLYYNTNARAGVMPLFRCRLIEIVEQIEQLGETLDVPSVGVDLPADLPRG